MTWNKSTTRSGSGAATAPTRTPAGTRNVVAEAAQESAMRRQEIQALLEEYARKQEAAAPAVNPAPVNTAAAPASRSGAAAAAAPAPKPAAPKASTPTTPASIDRRLHTLETSINRIEAKLSGGVRAEKVDEIAAILEDLLLRVRALRG